MTGNQGAHASAADAEMVLAGARLDAKTIAAAVSAAVKGATPFKGLVQEVLEGLRPPAA